MAVTLTPAQQKDAAAQFANKRYVETNLPAVFGTDVLTAGITAADTWLTANLPAATTAVIAACPGMSVAEARHIVRFAILKILGVI